MDSGGNAQAFIVIFEYGKLEIGLRRDFRDFAIFFILLLVFTGIKPRPLDPESNVLFLWPCGKRGSGKKSKDAIIRTSKV